MFDDDPHYHYIHAGDEIVNNVIDFDELAHGDMLPWAIELPPRPPARDARARGRRPPRRRSSTPPLVGPVIDEVAVIAAEAQRDIRAVRAATSGATAAGASS